ncbi:very short patch repair endonuclease [Pseudoalteromonas rubra]|uniref:Very short patch repair endonuclease n=1 Tax=Pseudoalteromonas rubra TaxID=43658 RepID=A0A5S3URU8_9GAMM|nr:very short patch repair endonuclease [Pseudoalteromonas rubra]
MSGSPDFVIPKYHAVIFAHGCFWHMHNCPMFKLPGSRAEWWSKKLRKQHTVDVASQDKLMEFGWRVLIIWECSTRGPSKINEQILMTEITDWLLNGGIYQKIPSPPL